MKNKAGHLLSILIVLAFLIITGGKLSGQQRVNISAGAGYPELLNIGVRFQIEQSQLGMSIGTWPSSDKWLFDWKNIVSLSGDYYYHFGGSSDFSDLRPWYGRIGLNFMKIIFENEQNTLLSSYFRVGRDFYFNRVSGFSLDAGVSFCIINEPGITPVLPAPGFGFFYRF